MLQAASFFLYVNSPVAKVIQLLIEKGCQFAARNNEGFTASDYALSWVVILVSAHTY